MPKYCEQDYSLPNALNNIGDYFWRLFKDDIKVFAQDRTRTDIPQRILLAVIFYTKISAPAVADALRR